MTKFERFAINHFLSNYPEDWSYPEILEGLNADDDAITIWEGVESIWPSTLVSYIEDMVSSLKNTFGK